MICLGIESTAHTFGVSIIKDKTILSNVKKSFTSPDAGMIPNKVAEQHITHCQELIHQALQESQLHMKDITLISYSQSPGIGQMLRVGCGVAKSLSLLHSIPIIGVNHCVAHLEIGRLLTKATDPILLYTSGANTQVIAYMHGKYRVFGETLDIGIGNLLDTVARYFGLGFPGGPKIAELANKSQTYIPLPYTVKGMDVSFGGILTNLKQKYDSKKYAVEDLCFSLQETVFAMMCEITERALAHCDKSQVIIGGGVGCNKRLTQMLESMCKQRGAQFYTIENQYLLDNAAMIAWLGILSYNSGNRLALQDATIHPYTRTDEITVTWRDD